MKTAFVQLNFRRKKISLALATIIVVMGSMIVFLLIKEAIFAQQLSPETSTEMPTFPVSSFANKITVSPPKVTYNGMKQRIMLHELIFIAIPMQSSFVQSEKVL